MRAYTGLCAREAEFVRALFKINSRNSIATRKEKLTALRISKRWIRLLRHRPPPPSSEGGGDDFTGKNLRHRGGRGGFVSSEIIARREAREIVEINKVLTPITVLLYLHLSFRYTIYRASCNKRETLKRRNL